MRAGGDRWSVVLGVGLLSSCVAAVGCDEPQPPSAVAPAASQGPAGVVTAVPPVADVAGQQPGAAPTPKGTNAESSDDGAARDPTDGVDRPADGALDCPPPEAVLDPVQILRFQFTSAVQAKNATDRLMVARPGQRVWIHLTVRNRTGRSRCLRVVFRVDGKERTSVDLEVGHSWSWRTWAYATLRSTDRSGRLEVELLDERGKRVTVEQLPIVPGP